jgi:hypothetical protein
MKDKSTNTLKRKALQEGLENDQLVDKADTATPLHSAQTEPDWYEGSPLAAMAVLFFCQRIFIRLAFSGRAECERLLSIISKSARHCWPPTPKSCRKKSTN